LLHLALELGALESNKELVEQEVCRAAGLGSEWIVTPELCISGYQFVDKIGNNPNTAQLRRIWQYLAAETGGEDTDGADDYGLSERYWG
jgi:predicted amidohydrolase